MPLLAVTVFAELHIALMSSVTEVGCIMLCYVQLSVTLREWDIPYNELERREKIGVGRFGTVYK